jgi:hypothetical protein
MIVSTTVGFLKVGFGTLPMEVTKPYKFIGSGAMEVTKPYEFIVFGAMDITKPCEFIGFGARCVTKPYEFMGFGARGVMCKSLSKREPDSAPPLPMHLSITCAYMQT